MKASLTSAALLLLLAGCGEKPVASEASTEAPAAVMEIKAPPLEASVALAAIDLKTLCSFYLRAMNAGETKLQKGDCNPVADGQSVKITSANGSGLLVSLVESGAKVVLSPELASPHAVVDAATGAVSNIGAVFIGRAGTAPLCMDVEYVAKDGNANSLFVATKGGVDPDRFSVPTTSGIASFATPVVPAGQTAPFAVTRREAGLGVKSFTFRNC